MVLRLEKISVLPLAGGMSALYTLIGLVIGVIVAIGSQFNQDHEGIWGLGIWAILLIPLINAVMGFISGFVIAHCYNLIMPLIGGGLELEFEQTDRATLKQP